MGSLIGGMIAVVLGIWGIIGWWGWFLRILMGSIPFLLLLGGAIAIFGGITSIKDQIAAKKEEEKIQEEEIREEEKKKEKKEKGAEDKKKE